MSAWPCRQELKGQSDDPCLSCPVSRFSGPSVPSRTEARQGGHLPSPGPSHQAAPGQACQELCQGGRHDGCRGTGRGRKCQSWRGVEALFPSLELVEGKIVCDDSKMCFPATCSSINIGVESSALVPAPLGCHLTAAGPPAPPAKRPHWEMSPAPEKVSPPYYKREMERITKGFENFSGFSAVAL